MSLLILSLTALLCLTLKYLFWSRADSEGVNEPTDAAENRR